MMKKYYNLRVLFVISLFGIIGIFSFTRFYGMIRGVPITISGIENGATLSKDIISITGKAPHATILSINDKIISTDKLGNFNESLMLPRGYSIMTVSAHDKFGNITKKTYPIFVQAEEKTGDTLGIRTESIPIN